MAITLTTPINLGNCTTWAVTRVSANEELNIGQVTIQFRTTALNLLVASIDLTITNGLCTKVSRVTPPSGGLRRSC